jgi:hypothetical protein
MADDFGECYPSLLLLSRRCNITPDTVRSHIVALEGFKMLKRVPRFKDNRQTSNLYVFLPASEWVPSKEGEGGVSQEGGVVFDGRGEGGPGREGEIRQYDPKDKHNGKVNGSEVNQESKHRFKPSPNQPRKQPKDRASRAEMEEFCKSLGLPESDGTFMFDHWESNGWKNGSAPVRDWKAGVRKWKGAGWLPSQKKPSYGTITGSVSTSSNGVTVSPPCSNWRDILAPITGKTYEDWMEWRDVPAYDRSQWPATAS